MVYELQWAGHKYKELIDRGVAILLIHFFLQWS